MFDIFYTGTKPNLFLHEKHVESIEQAQKQSRTRYCWVITYLADYSAFDFLWEPKPWESHQRHAWASQWQKDAGTYLIPKDWNGQDTNYHALPVITRLPSPKYWNNTKFSFDYSWHPDPTDPPMIYQFGTQWQKTGGPQYRVPKGVDVKYIDQPRVLKTKVDPCWSTPDGVDTSTFDYTWHPDATDPLYIYQFGTQHQRTGGPQYRVPGATDIKFVDQIKIKTNRVATAIVEIDHLDGNAGQIPGATDRSRYFDNYRDTLIRIAKKLNGQHEFVWVCSSICDYTDFDFSWHPEQWQAGMLHVFASDSEKFGDTFFMHVPTFAYRAERVELLEWYDCNFVEHSQVPRRAVPMIKYNADSVTDVIKNYDFGQPVVQFYRHTPSNATPVINLWRSNTKTVVPLSADNSTVIVPREAQSHIQQQLYDYPYIDKTARSTVASELQDIVFISYDEPEAEQNWQRLIQRFPRAQRVHGVKGMENALAEAARVSRTPWYFAVFGKTELHPNFDFSFRPDYFQQPKHYIFYSENRVNKLVYGEMAVIMYNCRTVLDNIGCEFGLDYTMSFPHEVIPIISTYGNFNTSPYHTWRTAFREVSKLYDIQSRQPTVETEYRIKIWETVAEGDYAEWALNGARDGREFYLAYKDDYAYRKNTFNWQWLRNYFSERYGDVN